MPMVTYPLNNIEYTAEDAELFHITRESGIYAKNSFDYSITGADNNIVIGKGIGWIKNSEFSGKVIAQKEPISLNMGLADSVYPRIDAIVIRFDANSNETNIAVKQGAATSSPVAPKVVQTESIYELHLYHVRREAGSLYIAPNDITDLRLNKLYCGLMADSVTTVNTAAIDAQIMALIEELRKDILAAKDGSAYVMRDGTTPMKANLPMGGFRMTELAAPKADGDAVNLEYAKKVGNTHNLLDNSDFRNPVNQRGKTSVTGEYLIDRWLPGLSSVALSLNSNGLTIGGGDATYNAHAIQKIDKNLIGKEITFAVCDSSGAITIASGTVASGAYVRSTKTKWGRLEFHHDSADGLLWANIAVTYGKSHTFRWAVLYEGKYTAETLPEYQPKGYAAELAECMRYYFKQSESITAAGYITGSQAILRISVPVPTVMRITPTLVNVTLQNFRAVNGGTYTPVVSGKTLTKYGSLGALIDFDITKITEVTTNTPISGLLYSLELSADL